MATLSETTNGTRKFFLGCLGLIIFLILGNFFIKLIETSNIPGPDSKIYADNYFGDLPGIKIPSLSLTSDSKPQYRLETEDGKLPEFTNVAYVYKYKTPRQTLTSKEESIELAKALGFDTEPEETTATELRWTSNQNSKVLVIDKITKSIKLSTDFSKPNDSRDIKAFTPSTSVYENALKSYAVNVLTPDYKFAKTTSSYLVFNENGKLKKSISPDRTMVSLVNIYKRFELDPHKQITADEITQNKIDQTKLIEVLGDSPKLNETRGIVGLNVPEQVYLLQSKNWEVDYDIEKDSGTNTLSTLTGFSSKKRGIYEIYNSSEAWDQLQNGNGSLTYLKKTDNDILDFDYVPMDVEAFEVYSISLKFYESPSLQEYLEPIYVFTGGAILKDNSKADFVMYIPAIKRI